MSDSGSNFVSDKFKTFCRSLNIEQAFSLSYHHQSYGQVEACIKVVKHALKKCFDSKGDPPHSPIANTYDPTLTRTPKPCNYAVLLSDHRNNTNH